MKKNLLAITACFMACLLLAGCGYPSRERIRIKDRGLGEKLFPDKLLYALTDPGSNERRTDQ